ncbi:hypothetical protein ACFR97_15715 [Haloplanus litoreus]|uniref:Uncharacterized protein n=1 Tax=Haloplanus litoreus TaxID=767515 RepID=A0ABD6A3B8_9EURY
MVSVVSLVAICLSLVGILLGYIYNVNSNRPTAAEISNAVRRRLPPNQHLGTNLHVARIPKTGVTDNDDWLNQYDDTEEQRIRTYLEGVFVGKAEVILYFEKPPISPPQDKLEDHPYFGEELTFEDNWAGTGPLNIEATDQSLILNFGIYADTTERGSAAVAGMVILVLEMVDHLIEDQILEDPSTIPSVDEVFSGDRLSEGEEPVFTIAEIPKVNNLKGKNS